MTVRILSDTRARKDKYEDDADDNRTEKISDEGIDDGGSDEETPLNDYLISTVSKTDLDLMSRSFLKFDFGIYLSFFQKKNITAMMKNRYP